MKTCVNLKERYGRRYRVSWDTESGEGPRDRDPWIAQIRCRRGLIYPFGGDFLAVQVDGHRLIAGRVAAIPEVTTIQDGNTEKTYKFHVDLFDQVAAIVLPYQRRRLSEESRTKGAERLKAWRAARASQNEEKRP